MINFIKHTFSLTDNGARDAKKAIFSSFYVYVINMIPAILIMILVNELVLGEVNNKYVYIGISVATLILMAIFLNIEYERMYNATYKESANLRLGISEKLSQLPLSYFSRHDLSDISQTIMSDVDGIEHSMSHAIPKVGAMVFFFPLISILLLVGNVKLGLAVILPTIISYIFIPISKKVQVRGQKKYYDILRENSENFQETIELQQEIKSFNISKDVKKDLYDKMEKSEKAHLKYEIYMVITMFISHLFSFLSLPVVIITGVSLLKTGEVNVLYVVGYLLAALKIKDALDSNKEAMMELFYITPKINRIKELMNANIQEGEDYKFNSFDIELKNVSFSYDENTKVLSDISFKANQGEVTALVGASGCGKTSILRLISRLYDYDGGKILIDGKDIKEVSTKSLFENISIVFQDVTLFNTSILENIRIGKKDATDEEVKRAAELANCTEFIEKLENGYDSLIGENGAELSSGERQRLSIARAFLKDAPILILDEISASLDVDNEKKIQDSLNKLIENKTVIIISHRLKSIENVDKIVVIDKGEVENIGSHNELMDKSKIYKNLIEKVKMAEQFEY